jgi:hypothetical protein
MQMKYFEYIDGNSIIDNYRSQREYFVVILLSLYLTIEKGLRLMCFEKIKKHTKIYFFGDF